MKKLLLFVCVLCSLAACTEKRPALVERPVFEVWNMGTLEIDKIEMSDSATILYIDAFFRPKNWIRISKETYIRESGTDDRLQITKSEGIGLDEEFYMPESGQTSFKLFFPPLKPDIVKIDFIESDCPDCFKTWGIHLMPSAKLKIDPLPEKIKTPQPLKPLPPPDFSIKKTRITGKISGYREDLGISTNLYLSNLMASNDETSINLPIAADGTFSGEVSGFALSTVSNSVLTGRYPLSSQILIPGETQEIFIDLKKKNRREARYRTDKEPGDSAYIFISSEYFSQEDIKTINSQKGKYFDYESVLEKRKDMTPDEYKAWVLEQLKQTVEKLPSGLSDNGKLFCVNTLKFNAIQLLFAYNNIKSYAYKEANKDNKNAPEYKPEKLDDSYYSFLGELLDDYMAYLGNYSYTVEDLVYRFVEPKDQSISVSERFTRFKDRLKPMLGGKDKGILFDVALMQMYNAQIQQAQFFTDTDKQSIRQAFNHVPSIADSLIADNDRTQILLESKGTPESPIRETPKVSNEKLFDEILSNYKGKVVLVDFWATWCGPCLYGHKLFLPLKEEFKGKNVVFLYLTGGSSPLVTWRKMLPTIHGEHYKVTDEQWRYWSQIFEIEGIPTYFVIDKEGKRIYRHTGVPALETIKKEIEKAL
ncbi:MAG: TlpA family protein disulfide reductase [Prevotellaceae bacterium]|jgi:thiol-disulfide isomerase/thioredoxin|nr:TlpA family protein disulfide reductase [Prevotellaceae bacterium]